MRGLLALSAFSDAVQSLTLALHCRTFAFVRPLLALVRNAFSLVRNAFSLVRDAVPFVGNMLASCEFLLAMGAVVAIIRFGSIGPFVTDHGATLFREARRKPDGSRKQPSNS
ncbi:hypothetical protein A5650_18535 [Mycobacterium sp. 1164985.4]|nr:hypothetical protein A5650_18535 [Mycobacterium sp. 1164985.4]